MVDDQTIGFQVGPKSDAAGFHVAVYAWWPGGEFFQRYDAVLPGSWHTYEIVKVAGGWAAVYEGRTLVTLDLNLSGTRFESRVGELTNA